MAADLVALGGDLRLAHSGRPSQGRPLGSPVPVSPFLDLLHLLLEELVTALGPVSRLAALLTLALLLPQLLGHVFGPLPHAFYAHDGTSWQLLQSYTPDWHRGVAPASGSACNIAAPPREAVFWWRP
ncbi:hypothetical protein [Streptomyces sp. NPDC051310]|uniref:hypothetical protein n=1 Tax=Streptomyces sp. NPDC051310 TaxID=3365649 RepID=UPI00379F9A5F